MSELLITNLANLRDTSVNSPIDALDLKGSYSREDSHFAEISLAATRRRSAPLRGAPVYQSERWIIGFSGDLVAHNYIPYDEIIAALSGSYTYFAQLDGIFAIAAFDKVERAAYLVSDRRGQKPLFVCADETSFTAATNLAVFVRLLENPSFDRRWLWESLYFNFPTGGTTFLESVFRVGPSCVVRFECGGRTLTTTEYAPPVSTSRPLLRGEQGLSAAVDVFRSRVPAYFEGEKHVACALTAGWDGRTILAFAPPDKEITTYTYGTPGCADLIGAAATALDLNVENIQIPFGKEFSSSVTDYAFETVFLSGGQQGILRATLLYVYETLTNAGKNFPLTLSGIALDMAFRGHAHCPNLIAPDIEARFRARENSLLDWTRAAGENHGEFTRHIEHRLSELQERFGSFSDSSHHLSYLMYPLSTHHFCGEIAIADYFTTVRVPSWDSAIVDLAFSIEQSTLSHSQFLAGNTRGSRREMILQARLLRECAPEFFRIPVMNTRPAAVLAGEAGYQLERVVRKLSGRAKPPAQGGFAPLEDWGKWLFEDNNEFIMDLLQSSDTCTTEYVTPEFVRTTVLQGEQRILGKLLTAEIIIRLVKNRWQKFW